MFDIAPTKPPERVVLAGVHLPDLADALFEEDMAEMAMLCFTAGAEIVATVVQKRDAPDSSTYIGGGKLSEIKAILQDAECTTLIIDAELSPGQVNNIEKRIEAKVIDRSQLILDIFAANARTQESRVQVELAQLRMLYPRLTRAWTHFSKQTGGIGTRGPGETQLEVDRRLVQSKISELRARLKKIEKSRDTQRKSRRDMVNIALVGYTNVGKSSLLNALSGADLLVENKLFATLDTASRKTWIQGIGEIIVTDTVGFLRKLPHQLVASFRSTLEVAKQTDLLCIVLDAASPWSAEQFRTVEAVLTELEAVEAPRMVIFNKGDLVTDPLERARLAADFPGSVIVSAFDKDEIKGLKEVLAERVGDILKEREREARIAEETKRAMEVW